jgi:xanthosine utilization system XapX-like protein/preprotein translocase subunit Sss1
MSIFGTPEERKQRQQEQEAAIAEAKQKMKEKLLALWNRVRQLPAPIQAALIGILGIIIGNIMGRSTSAAQWRDAQNATAAQFHRDRLTQIYSDCMYYSFRLETALSTTKQIDWNSIKDDASQTLRAGNLLWAYLKKPQWEEMSQALTALQVHSIGYAYGIPSSNDRDQLRRAAGQIYYVAHMSYQYDGRIFERWKNLTDHEDEDEDKDKDNNTRKSSPSPTPVP